ncbi:hypothetical protein [Desulfotalea psychrophila]|uniref:Similar to amino acid transport protein (Partial length) n=1 Tax=Desulfotalea psychrophila (strain LSv54 / DSM 12343) TaxID=177439 RepID=Q6AKP7_DESPS|nr:hypothetical protein [Desulfotalea psychrophila]CAG37078.1 similar to amino acid transport protein (partial length) [Desulfotalea psychrophila LSv54]
MNTSTLMWGVIFGSMGLALLLYGKRQTAIIPFLSGIGLMLMPYFISNIFILVPTGIVLVACPFLLKNRA